MVVTLKKGKGNMRAETKKDQAVSVVLETLAETGGKKKPGARKGQPGRSLTRVKRDFRSRPRNFATGSVKDRLKGARKRNQLSFENENKVLHWVFEKEFVRF